MYKDSARLFNDVQTYKDSIRLFNDVQPLYKSEEKIQPDSISALFSNMSIYFNENDHISVISITATRKDGRKYTLKKEDGVITDFSIDGEKITKDQMKYHVDELNDLESACKVRREKLTWKRPPYLKSDALDSARRTILTNRQKLLVENEQSLLDRQMQYLKAKLANVDANSSLFNTKQQSMLRAQMFTLKKQQLLFENQLQPNDHKKDEMQKPKEDDVQFRSSVEQIKKIISDLRHEHINFNERESWFGLDNKQFVVDGKPMSTELHEKFKAKYISPDGMGYYYGSPQVTGRGVFMDYYSTHPSVVQ